MELWTEFFKTMAPAFGWILLGLLLVLVVLNWKRVQTLLGLLWVLLVLNWKHIQSWIPESLKRIGTRIGWMLVGALLLLFAMWCRCQYGEEVAFQMYLRALAEKPADMKAVERLFAGSHITIASASREFSVFRCRFSGGGEIDVAFDGNRRVVDIHPTFASDGIAPLTWLLHRRGFFTVPLTIPEKNK